MLPPGLLLSYGAYSVGKKGAVKMELHQKKNKQDGKQLFLAQNRSEQTAELHFSCDYLLADYLPDIFKILKFDVTPYVTDVTVMPDRVVADICLEMRVLYLAEQTHSISLITQKQTLQKQLDIPGMDASACVHLWVRTDTARYRVINPRRVELKGTLSVKCHYELPKQVNFYAPSVKAKDHQIKLMQFEGITQKKQSVLPLTVSEETPLPYGSAPIKTVLLYRGTPFVEECRFAGDKAVCKGKIEMHLLYLPQGEDAVPATFSYTVPVDCVVQTEEISPDATVYADLSLTGVTLEPNESGGIDGQYAIAVSVTAVENAVHSYIGDMYSTKQKTRLQTEEITPLAFTRYLRRNQSCSHTVSVTDGGISQVYDLFCDISGLTAREAENGNLQLAVNLHLTLLAMDENKTVSCLEKSVPVEFEPDGKLCKAGEQFDLPQVKVVSSSYRIMDGGSLEVRTELLIEGECSTAKQLCMVSGVSTEENAELEQEDAALHLYFAKAGEDIWEIAKSFAADYDAVLKENEVEEGNLPQDQMLLIPSAGK